MTEQEIKELLKNNLNEYYVYNLFINEKLDESILEKYIGYFDPLCQFEMIVTNKIPESWWIKFVENESVIKKLWDIISTFQKLSEEFIERHFKELNYYSISEYQKLSEEFIEKYSKKLSWYSISKFQHLSEEFVERHSDKVNWHFISKFQKLSDDFIERHSDNVDWYYISIYKKVSEDFIEKHSDIVNWYLILMYQNLSEKFKTIMRNKLK